MYVVLCEGHQQQRDHERVRQQTRQPSGMLADIGDGWYHSTVLTHYEFSVRLMTIPLKIQICVFNCQFWLSLANN